MNEKRFICGLGFPINSDDPIRIISDNVEDKDYYKFSDICNVLNEQQELIEELHISDHMGWGRAEKFEKELKQKKIYIKRLEYKVQKFKEMNGEQQATIEAKNEYQRTLEAKIRRLKDRIKVLEKNE